MKSNRKTVIKSFRLDEEALMILKEEAGSQTVSLNTLANQLVLNYANFGRYLRRVGGMVLSQQTLYEFINSLPEDSAINVGKRLGKTSPQQLIAAINGEVDVTRVIEFIQNLSSIANWFQYTKCATGTGRQLKITLTHAMGRNWSQFITHYLLGAFEAAGCQPGTNVADSYVTLTI
jgi:hypothetical protein